MKYLISVKEMIYKKCLQVLRLRGKERQRQIFHVRMLRLPSLSSIEKRRCAPESRDRLGLSSICINLHLDCTAHAPKMVRKQFCKDGITVAFLKKDTHHFLIFRSDCVSFRAVTLLMPASTVITTRK